MNIKLSEVLQSLESGGRPKGGATIDNTGIPSIGAEHLNSYGAFNFKSVKYIPEKYFSSLANGKIESGDILIVKDGATTGKVSFVNEHFPFKKSAVNEHVFLLKIDKLKASPKYVFQYLRTPQGQRNILRDFRGATVGGISRGFIDFVAFPLPPLIDQIQIANILSKAQSLIEQRKQSIALLDELLKSSFLEMFGEGNQFDWKYIPEIASKEKHSLSSGPFGSNLTSQHYTSSGVIILRGTNITSGKLDLSNVKYISEEKAFELKRSEIKPNDVVIVAVGSSGKALKVPSTLHRAIMSQNFNKITPNKNLIDPVYLEFCINDRIVQQQFKKKITDTVRTFLSLTSIKEIKIPVPPIEFQTQFARLVEKTEALIEQYKNSLQELEYLYGSLSQQAFKGELEFKNIEQKVKMHELEEEQIFK